jgi:TolA-binding protein
VPRSLAIFIALSFLSLIFLGVALGMVYQLIPDHRRRPVFRWLLVWAGKGLFLPLTIWFVMNLGISWNLQPFMPRVQYAQISGGHWIIELLRATAQGLFILSSDWAAITVGWTLVRAGVSLEGEPRSDFKALCWTCLGLMVLPAAGIFWLGGWPVAGLAAMAILAPVASYTPAILGRVKNRIPPMYARAIAKMKFGKYSEAEWEIIRELEKHEDDFDGWMMLAELYANQFKDLAEAEQTILEICEQPRTTPSQLSIALHRLADWYLKLAGDPDAARRALQMISSRLPETHLARMAQLRINQLPKTAEDLQEQQTVTSVRMPALGDQLDDPVPPEPTMSRSQAAAAANECVEKLKRDPNHIGAREKLARLFTEQLGKPELGIQQISLLLDLPGESPLKKAEWKSLIAAWHLRYRQDPETARGVLAEIIAEFPHTPQAMAAHRRIRLIDTESTQRLAGL